MYVCVCMYVQCCFCLFLNLSPHTTKIMEQVDFVCGGNVVDPSTLVRDVTAGSMVALHAVPKRASAAAEVRACLKRGVKKWKEKRVFFYFLN